MSTASARCKRALQILRSEGGGAVRSTPVVGGLEAPAAPHRSTGRRHGGGYSRRGLRGAIERRGLAHRAPHRELLGAFEPLLRELDAVDAEADSLSDACASIAVLRLREARVDVDVLLAATARLREDSRLNERRQELCELFEREFMRDPTRRRRALNAPADAAVDERSAGAVSRGRARGAAAATPLSQDCTAARRRTCSARSSSRSASR